MPKGMSEDVSKVVVDALNRGLTRGEIAGVVGISKRAITRINSNMKKHGSAKAPPTGAKLGRPVKLTKSQADAMIVWMAERDHTFYVKDLVAFLKDQYRYKGCDGTIRRCLIRAGYKRKQPWHKSEITVWIPPDYRPSFVTAAKQKARAANAAAQSTANRATVQQPLQTPPQDEPDISIPPAQDYHHDLVDPSLDKPQDNTTTSPSFQMDQHFAFETFTHPTDPYRIPDDHPTSHVPMSRPSRLKRQRPKPTSDVSALQTELSQKNALIAQLQQQLAAQSFSQTQSPLQQPSFPDLSTADTHSPHPPSLIAYPRSSSVTSSLPSMTPVAQHTPLGLQGFYTTYR